jgi:hypothetical protein
MSESPKLGDWIEGKDGKKHQVKECQTCKKLFIFMDDKTNPKGFAKFNLDGSPHIDQKQFQARKPSESFKFTHSVRQAEGVIDSFEISRTGNLGELQAEQTFKEMEMIVRKISERKTN